MVNRFTKRKFRIGLCCVVLVVFLGFTFLPLLTQQSLLFASASSGVSSTDALAVKNPCDWWWGCNTNNYDWLILNYSNKWNLPDPMVIKAEMALESGFNTTARAWNSYCESYDEGLMQVNPTCNDLNAAKLYHAVYNTDHATEIWGIVYQELLEKWGSSCGLKNLVMGTLEVYNLGPGGAGSSCASFPEGTQYASEVLTYYYQFCTDSGYKPRF
jgi:hypothetical protein